MITFKMRIIMKMEKKIINIYYIVKNGFKIYEKYKR